jgi:photosystem II stability/assembly factor-like uncharacterized protein
LFRVDAFPFETSERVVDCGRVSALDGHDETAATFAATDAGLYRSTDDGRTWDTTGLPEDDVWEVFLTRDGDVYAGTDPARLFRSTDDGDTWTELDSLRRGTTTELWRSAYRDRAHVRTVVAHPETPERLFAGIEVGGLHRSEDGGETWSKCEIRDEAGVVQDDIHKIGAVTPEEYVVACGRLSLHDPNHAAAEGGLYHTTDAGVTWGRLDRDLGPSYYRSVVFHEGALYTCGATTVPPEWSGVLDADATMFVSDDVGDTFETVRYPGGPDEIVLAYASNGTRLFAGTGVGDEGRVLRRTSDRAWETVGHVPEDVLSLHVD